MKPINSREKSKQLWQFVIIFFGLALVPVALIFFSYYRVPEEISESEAQKLITYSHFEHTQKEIIAKMIEIDTNINRYRNKPKSREVSGNEIGRGLADLKEFMERDSSIQWVGLIRTAYENHFSHVKELVLAEEEKADALSALETTREDLKKAQSQLLQPMYNPQQGSVE